MSAERLFSGNKTYTALVNKGPVLGLEFAGVNCIQTCQQALKTLISTKFMNLPRKILPDVFSSSQNEHSLSITDFISQSPSDALDQLDKFYNFASMQMFA